MDWRFFLRGVLGVTVAGILFGLVNLALTLMSGPSTIGVMLGIACLALVGLVILAVVVKFAKDLNKENSEEKKEDETNS
jgi:hypothetical protein